MLSGEAQASRDWGAAWQAELLDLAVTKSLEHLVRQARQALAVHPAVVADPGQAVREDSEARVGLECRVCAAADKVAAMLTRTVPKRPSMHFSMH